MRYVGIAYGVLAILAGIGIMLMPPNSAWATGNAVYGILFILFGIYFVVRGGKQKKE